MAKKVDSSAHLRTQPSRAGKKDLDGNSMFDEKHYKQCMASVRPRSAMYSATSLRDGICPSRIVRHNEKLIMLFSINNFYLKREMEKQFQFFYMEVPEAKFPTVGEIYNSEEYWVELDKDETEINESEVVKYNIK